MSLIQIALAAPLTLDLDADDSTASGSDYATTFTEDGGGVTIADTDIMFSAPTLASATITLTNLLPGDLLSVGTLPDGVTAVYDPSTGVMRLTGAGSAANFQAASDQIFYSNNSDNPATDDRIITVVVNDGINDSNIATAIVKVVAVNDPPSLSVSAAASYTENDLAALVSPAATVSDVDSPNLTIGIVAITDGLNPGDVLTVGGLRSGALGSIRFNWAPSLSELIVTGGGSPEEYEALFQSVRFHSDSDDPTNGGADTTRTISWVVFDGTKHGHLDDHAYGQRRERRAGQRAAGNPGDRGEHRYGDRRPLGQRRGCRRRRPDDDAVGHERHAHCCIGGRRCGYRQRHRPPSCSPARSRRSTPRSRRPATWSTAARRTSSAPTR